MIENEEYAIECGEPLRLKTVLVRGTYADGTEFVREYPINIWIHQGDTFNMSYKISYPDLFAAAMNP